MTLELAGRTQNAEREDTLVRRARDGDTSAFDELVQMYHPRLTRFAYRLLQDHSDVEDVVQTVFLRAYQALKRFRPGGSLTSWFYTITLNECRRKLRRRILRRTRSEDLAATVPSGPGTDPVSCVLREDRNRMVQEAVMELPEHYREAVVLFYFEDMSVEEMARVMGITVSAAKVRLHRARARLAQRLGGRI